MAHMRSQESYMRRQEQDGAFGSMQGGVTGCGEALLGAGRRYWVQGGSNYRGREVWSWRQGVSVAPT